MAELRWSILAVGLILAATMFAFTFRYELLTGSENSIEIPYVWAGGTPVHA